jgi:chromosomal replication initiator protein
MAMTPSAEAIWSAAQEILKGMLKPEIYTLWFASVQADGLENGTLRLRVADEFCELWLRDNYLDLLRSVVSRAAVAPLQVEFRVECESDGGGVNGIVPPQRLLEGGVSAGSAQEGLEDGAQAAEEEERFREASTDGASGKASSRSSNPSLSSAAKPAPRPMPKRSEPGAALSGSVASAASGSSVEGIFNSQNTFETFVVGSNNQFAHSVAMAVAQNPGKSFNPLFLFGGVGLGKTHLLQAIGHHVLASRRSAKIAYLSCERFTNDFIDALQNNSVVRFRRKYRQVDVLLVDDIQFLGGKERIQEEFFHTFNTLHEARKQIVMTCDRPANEIKGLEERLISRFEWGQTADLQPPDVETRLAILRKKSKAMGSEVPSELVDYLAQRIRTNVRRLEGAFNRVASYHQLTGRPVTVEILDNLLRDILDEEGSQTVTVEVIQKKVAEHFDLRMADMVSKRRPENIAFPRQIAMYLARRLTEMSLSSIGEAFGGRDHGTVLHACRQVRDRMEVDSSVRSVVSQLERQLSR